MIHLSETGLNAGRRLCLSKEGESVHAMYAPLQKQEFRDTCCQECLKIWAKEAYEEEDEMPEWVKELRSSDQFEYFINLDERGDFRADVRNNKGETVFEIRAGNSLEEDEASIFDDGFMKDKRDLEGLTAYLRDLGVISKTAEVVKAN